MFIIFVHFMQDNVGVFFKKMVDEVEMDNRCVTSAGLKDLGELDIANSRNDLAPQDSTDCVIFLVSTFGFLPGSACCKD